MSLSDCPFCGGFAEYRNSPEPGVFCTSCPASIVDFDALSKWDERVPAPTEIPSFIDEECDECSALEEEIRDLKRTLKEISDTAKDAA